MILQLIGKGGIGREVSQYLNSKGVSHCAYEGNCYGINPFMGAVIAIGDEEARADVVDQFPDQAWVNVNLGSSYDLNNKIGVGTIICPGSVLTTNVTVGKHCLINLNCTIGHDAVIGDFVTVAPGVNISGNVTIGQNCNIGSNAVIRQGITICDDVVIGCGAVVVKDITVPGTYVGNPVKRLEALAEVAKKL